MQNKIKIENTFAEAFPMKASRLIITAHNINWAREAAKSFCGFATSVIESLDQTIQFSFYQVQIHF